MTKISELNNIESLLNQVKNITEHFDKIAEERGEKFNVFDIIGLRNDEVKMHSKFLGNLLNPKGSHGMGNVFLNLFITLINNKFPLDHENKPIITFNEFEEINQNIVERHVDFVSKDKREGGRIDIILEDKSQILIIENKIYAGNQKNQLVRYTNAAKAINKKQYFVIYLTLDGKEMPYEEKDEIFKNCFNYNCLNKEKLNLFKKIEKSNNNTSLYLPISYEVEILDWLNECIKETYDKPLLREGIKHYINLIKILTNQTFTKEMEQEIQNYITKNKLEEVCVSFIDNLDIIKSTVLEKYIREFNNFKKLNNDNLLGIKKSCISIKSWSYENKNLELFLYFKDNFNDLYIGICFDNCDEEFNHSYCLKFKILEIFGFKTESWTISQKRDDSIFNCYNTWADLFKESTIEKSKNYLNSIINEIDKIVISN